MIYEKYDCKYASHYIVAVSEAMRFGILIILMLSSLFARLDYRSSKYDGPKHIYILNGTTPVRIIKALKSKATPSV
jgi:hypothetical protein